MTSKFDGLNTNLVHQLKKKIEELNGEKERYAQLFEQSNDGIILSDFNGKIFGANKKIGEITGYSEKELLNKSSWMLPLKSERKRVEEDYKKCIQGKKERIENKMLRKDGKIIDVEAGIKIVKLKDVSFLQVIVRDITEKKRTEEKLKESEEMLKFLVSSSPAVIYTCKAYGDFGATFVSENIKQQTGYEPEEYTKNPSFWASKIHPEDKKRVFEELKMLFIKGKYTHEYRFKFKDGKYSWMRDEMRLIKDEKGKPREIIGSWIDITERKKAENALKERYKELQCLYALSKLVEAYNNNNNNNKAFFNALAKEIEKAMQYPEEAVSKILLDGKVYPKGELCSCPSRLKENIIVNKKNRGTINVCYESKNNFLKEEKMLLTTVAERVGKVIERMEIEDSSKESEEKFKAIFDNAGEGILIADAKTKKFAFANPRICKILGYKENELLKLKVDDIHPKKDLPHVMDQFKKQVQKKILTSNLPVLRKDKKVIFCDITATPLIIGGKEYLAGFFLEK